MSSRDNFSTHTRQHLAEMVNYHCVKPGCNILTRGPSEDGRNVVSFGQAAHITAAREKGPRYDSSLTPEQRRASDNGAHLCANHARLVDVDQEAYPVSLLRQWQRDAIERAKSMFHQRPRYGIAITSEVNKEARAFFKLCEQVRISVRSPITNGDLAPILNVLNECRWQYNDQNGGAPSGNWQAGDSYHMQDTHATNIQINALRAIAQFVQIVRSQSNGWYCDDYGYYYPEGVGSNGLIYSYGAATKERIDAVLRRSEDLLITFRSELVNLRRYLSDGNTNTSL